tara:strand:- start:64266 stop:64778 length:513 start_codon:yes stop_codon:yes gene_type:complete
MAKKNDNPVPSIDNFTKEEREALLILLTKQINGLGSQWKGSPVAGYFTNLISAKEKLQNGVETDKEQPKCDECKTIIQINKICNCPTGPHKIYLCDCDNDECNPSLLRTEESCEKEYFSQLKPCSCKVPHYGFKSIAICTDCIGVKDKEFWNKLEIPDVPNKDLHYGREE